MWPLLSQADLTNPGPWEQFGIGAIVFVLMAIAIVVLARQLLAALGRERALYDRVASQGAQFAPLLERLLRELERREHRT